MIPVHQRQQRSWLCLSLALCATVFTMLKYGASASFRAAASRARPRGRWAPVQAQASLQAQAPRYPRAVATRLFATSADDVAKVTSAIAAKGEEIRQLKADKAPKEAIVPAVEALLKLKKEYEALAGVPFDPPKEGKDEKPKAAAAPAAPKAKREPVAAEPAEPIVRADYYAASLGGEGIGYGDFDLMASQGETGRVFAPVEVRSLSVWLARLDTALSMDPAHVLTSPLGPLPLPGAWLARPTTRRRPPAICIYTIIHAPCPLPPPYRTPLCQALGTAAGPQVGETVWVRGRVASVRAKVRHLFLPQHSLSPTSRSGRPSSW